MKYSIQRTTQFKKDVQTAVKRGLNLDKLKAVLQLLVDGENLPTQYYDHALRDSRSYKNCRELHIEPNWLLVYKYSKAHLILYLVRTGTHSDLF